MAHCLIVGGTGMLRGVGLGLAAQGHVVTAVARSHRSLAKLAQEGEGITPAPADYRDLDQFAMALRSAMTARGPFSLAVCWVHDGASSALDYTVQALEDARPTGRLVHVVGSALHEPCQDSETARLRLEHPGVAISRVVLGFIIEEGGSRWLTHDEVAAGVLRAIQGGADESVVGVVKPWDLRP